MWWPWRPVPARAAVVPLVIGLISGCAAGAGSTPPLRSPSVSPSAATPSLAVDSPAPSGRQASASPVPDASAAEAPGAWVRLGDLSVPRSRVDAMELAGGRVLVIDREACNGMSDLHGPPDPNEPTDILDIASGRWSAGPPLTRRTRMAFASTALPDGSVLVTGGDNGWDGAYSSTLRSDPASASWAPAALMSTGRIDPVAELLPDGRVLVAGGSFSNGYSSEADFFSGRTPAVGALVTAEVYDPATDRWSPTGSLHDPGSAGTAFGLPDGRVLAIGDGSWGRSQQVSAEVYDPASGSWTIAGRVTRPVGSAAVVLDDGSLLVIGGMVEAADGGLRPIVAVHRFDPRAGIESQVAPLPAPRADAVAVVLADGRVLLAGGTGAGAPLASGEPAAVADASIYDPVADRWLPTAPMPFSDRPAAAVGLHDGSILVLGGLVPFEQDVADGCPDGEPVGWTARFTPGEPGS